MLLTAHYDGVGDLPGLRQPAAADNGSGVAVVLEAARVLAAHLPDGVGLSVALLDARGGGRARLRPPRRAAARDGATPLVINVDGAGNLHQAAAVEAGGPAHALLAALDQAGRHTGLPLRRRAGRLGQPPLRAPRPAGGRHRRRDGRLPQPRRHRGPRRDRHPDRRRAARRRDRLAGRSRDPATLQSLIGDKR